MPSHASMAAAEFKALAYSADTLPLFVHKGGKPVIVCINFFLSSVRHYGCEMVKMLMTHQKRNRLLEQSVSTCDLGDAPSRIKKKVSAWQEKCLLCASIATANMRSNIPNLSLSHSSSAESFCSWE